MSTTTPTQRRSRPTLGQAIRGAIVLRGGEASTARELAGVMGVNYRTALAFLLEGREAGAVARGRGRPGRDGGMWRWVG